jgi:hypothetical protein
MDDEIEDGVYDYFSSLVNSNNRTFSDNLEDDED